MKKLVFFFVFLGLSAYFVFAQNTSKSTLVGEIIDASNKEPVPYASIVICKLTDSTIVSGAISTDKGTYQIDGLPVGSYYVKLSFLGYDHLTISPIEITGHQYPPDQFHLFDLSICV